MTGGRGRLAALALVALGVTVTPAWGQSDTRVGVRLGVAISTMEFEDPATDGQTGQLIGFHAGLTIGRDLGRFFSAETGLIASREGFGGRGAHTGDLRRLTLGLPVLFSARTPGRISVHLSGGMAAKLALGCRQVHNGLDGAVPCRDPVMGSSWSRFDLAALGGLGVAVPTGKRTLSTDFLLSLGLRDVGASDGIPGSARDVSLSLTVGVSAPWGSLRQEGDR